MTELTTQSSRSVSSENVVVDTTYEDAYERGKVDINFFAALALPDVTTSPLPEFYVLCFRLLVSRKDIDVGKILRFALGLPRGHAKTTFVKILVAWLIVYDKARFIVVVSATEGNAQNITEDISSMLATPNMKEVYGDWEAGKIIDNKETKKFTFHNKIIILEAKGANTAVRGLNKNYERPDCIVCDDMQTRENDESPTESAKLLRWFTATLLKCIDTKGDRLVIYIGNMYSDECILKKLQRSKEWISLVTGAILVDGTPLWPELHSLESLQRDYEHDLSLGLADVWFAEVMNDPRNMATSLLNADVPLTKFYASKADGVFMTIDPAGYRGDSDDNVIIVHEVHDGRGYISAIKAAVMDPQDTIRHAIAMALEHGVSVIGVETVAYQQALKFWLEYFMNELNITEIEVVELKPHKRSKESRIRAFVSELLKEEYGFVNEAARAAYIYQALAYKLGKKDNRDDILDCAAYGLDMRNEYWAKIKNNKNLINDPNKDVQVEEDNTPF